MRKFDSPKKRLLPPDDAANDVPVTAAGVFLGDESPVGNGAISRGLPSLLTDTGLDEAG